MLSRKSHFLIGFVFLLAGCDTPDKEVVLEGPPMTIEALEKIVNNITFTGTLPNNQIVNFNPSEVFPAIQNNNFSEGPTTNYVVAPDGLEFDITSTNISEGELLIDFSGGEIEIKFQYAFFSTLGELEKMFPNDVDVPIESRNEIIGIGIGDRGYDIRDAVDGEVFGVTDYLVVLGIPDSGLLTGTFYSEDGSQSFITLEGSFELSSNTLTSVGNSFFVLDFRTFLGPYELHLRQ